MSVSVFHHFFTSDPATSVSAAESENSTGESFTAQGPHRWIAAAYLTPSRGRELRIFPVSQLGHNAAGPCGSSGAFLRRSAYMVIRAARRRFRRSYGRRERGRGGGGGGEGHLERNDDFQVVYGDYQALAMRGTRGS